MASRKRIHAIEVWQDLAKNSRLKQCSIATFFRAKPGKKTPVSIQEPASSAGVSLANVEAIERSTQIAYNVGDCTPEASHALRSKIESLKETKGVAGKDDRHAAKESDAEQGSDEQTCSIQPEGREGCSPISQLFETIANEVEQLQTCKPIFETGKDTHCNLISSSIRSYNNHCEAYSPEEDDPSAIKDETLRLKSCSYELESPRDIGVLKVEPSFCAPSSLPLLEVREHGEQKCKLEAAGPEEYNSGAKVQDRHGDKISAVFAESVIANPPTSDTEHVEEKGAGTVAIEEDDSLKAVGELDEKSGQSDVREVLSWKLLRDSTGPAESDEGRSPPTLQAKHSDESGAGSVASEEGNDAKRVVGSDGKSERRRMHVRPPLKLLRDSQDSTSALANESLTEYERRRLQNIQRNNEVLFTLGLSAGAVEPPKPKARSASTTHSKAAKAPPVHTGPLRRSGRNSRSSHEHEQIDGGKCCGASGAHAGCDRRVADEAEEEEPAAYEDSSVLRYTCRTGAEGRAGERAREGGGSPSGQAHLRGGAHFQDHPASAESRSAELGESAEGEGKEGSKLMGFRALPGLLWDPSLLHIYTLDVLPAAAGARDGGALVAAAGHQGRVAVFGCASRQRGCSGAARGERAEEDGGELAEEVEPLMSWKAGRGWISHVQFLSNQCQEDATLMLTSSNDHSVILWDLNRQRAAAHGRQGGGAASAPPRILAQETGLHSQGIFGMHEMAGQVLTASKDRSVGLSLVGPTGIVSIRHISGHHEAAVRSVRFRIPDIAADCGADGVMCVLDLRLPQPCSLSISAAHASEINVVEWHPASEHTLLSASHDQSLLLHDIRSPSQPLLRLSGHVSPRIQRCSQIYRPAFVAGGSAIATTGELSGQLSLYCSQTGEAVSRGHMGYDANLVMACRVDDRVDELLFVAGRQVEQFRPLWDAK